MPVPQTQADAPSGFLLQSYALSLIICQIISSKLYADPFNVIQVYLEKGSCFGVPFLPSNKNFPQCPVLICVKRFLLILPRSLFTPTVFEKLLQDICPFCILFIHFFFLHFLYQFTNLKFPHLLFVSQNPSYK